MWVVVTWIEQPNTARRLGELGRHPDIWVSYRMGVVQITAAFYNLRRTAEMMISITPSLTDQVLNFFKLVLLRLSPRVVFEVMAVVFSTLGPNSSEI
jgi:hypothetical protein